MSSVESFNVEAQTSVHDETCLNNVIDKEVKTVLFPLNLMQILVLNPKFHIKDNFIRPNNCLNKFILFCGLLIFLSSYMYRITEIIIDDNIKRYCSVSFLYFAFYFDFAFCSAGFIMNVIIHCIQTKKIVIFVLTFQEVHRFLNSAASFKRSVIRNWLNVIIFFSFYIIIVLLMTVIYSQPPWYVVLNLLFLASLDTNLIYVISLIKLLADKVELWNNRILLSKRNEHNEDGNKMLESYVHILRCYALCKNEFQQPVLYQTIETFCRSLINVQIMIEFRKLFFVTTPIVSIYLYFWILKTLVIQLVLSLQVETFYEAVKLAQDSCASILASNCTDDQKKLCKNIQRVHRASYSKMSACGLFYIDICQPLRLLALLTHYTVVLLQFAFL